MQFIRSLLTLACLATAITAAPAPQSSTNGGGDNSKYINFNKGWSQVASPDLKFTDRIMVNYDLDRILPLCGADVNTPNVTVTAYHTALGTSLSSTIIFKTQSQAPTYQSTQFIIDSALPSTPEIQFWFTCTKQGQPPKYDSNYGNNFKFPLQGAFINFSAGYVHSVRGQLKAGMPVVVSYDHARAPCKLAANDIVESVTAFYFYTSSNAPIAHSNVYNAYWGGRAGPQYQISTAVIPAAQAGEIQFFFECQTPLGGGWDSDYGRNWRFTVAA
ncbi:hypothetical protein HDU97_008051 [Phlyctochytrium planicorne]|nr:hypothetical protein HDU97_008051 [Phlyctochytrium planicorne]